MPSTRTNGGSRGGLTRSLAPAEVCRSYVKVELLRAVRVHKVFRRMGDLWANRGVSSAEQEHERYAMSEQVERIDDFISHDWATSRWSKFLVLCFVYNARFATLASLLFSVALLTLMAVGLLPMLCMLETTAPLAGRSVGVCVQVFFVPLGCSVFWFIFLWGQWAKAAMRRRSRTAFVDKVCIDQADTERKRQGILSLAGFLGSSDRLVVLWTSRYLTRLWCVYELATWLHIAERGHSDFGEGLKFMPVSKAVICMMIQVCTLCACPFIYWSQVLSMNYIDWKWGDLARNGLPGFALFCAFTYFCREPVRDLTNLPLQVSSFAIRRSKCFCCCNNHLHPLTGQAMPCDRRLIYMALCRWFSDEKLETEEAVLDCFDALVRYLVQRHILARAAVSRMSYVETLTTCLPLILFQLDMMCTSGFPPEQQRRRCIYGAAMCLLVYPFLLKATMMVLVEVTRFGLRIEHFVCKCAFSVGVGGVVALVGLVGVMPLWVASAFDHLAALWCAVALYGLLCAVFFGPCASRQATRAEAGKDEPVEVVLNKIRITIASQGTATTSGTNIMKLSTGASIGTPLPTVFGLEVTEKDEEAEQYREDELRDKARRALLTGVDSGRLSAAIQDFPSEDELRDKARRALLTGVDNGRLGAAIQEREEEGEACGGSDSASCN